MGIFKGAIVVVMVKLQWFEHFLLTLFDCFRFSFVLMQGIVHLIC